MASSKKNLGKTTDIVTEADNPPQLGPLRDDDDTFWQGSADIGPRRRRSPRKHSTQAPTFVDPGRNAAVFSGNDHVTEDDRDLGDDHRTPRAVRTHAHNPRHSAEQRPSSYTLGLQKGMQSAHKLYSVRSKSTTTSSQSRSSSPVKRALDLQMLSKPVYWSHSTDFKEIQTSLKAFPDVLGIFNEARRIAGHGLQYLPMELKPELQDILAIDPDLDICFASERPVARLTRASRYRAAMIHRAVSPMPPTESQLQQIAHMDYLATEMQTLHELADLTNEFKTVPRSEAAWNSGIHEPILRLAVKSCQREDQDEDHGLPCCAEAENITRANIAKPFLPTADHTIVTSTASLPSSSSSSARSVEMSSTGVGHLQATTGTNARETELQITAGKMIDFAIVLRPPPPATMSGSGDSLIRSLYHFVKSLPEGTNFFNQCTYEPLIFSPSGVFIETKIDSRQYAEAQNQLGIWLASWFGRIRAIREYISESRQDQGLTRTPCIPVLLVVADAWQLWFAVDGERQIDVLGPVNCGGTSTLDDAYRLFAVLRRLVKWVGNGGFRAWVEEMVSLY